MVKLKLLGGAALESEKGPIAQRAIQRRRIALLALLTVARKAVSREKITAYLWPESDSEQARHLLSVAVYELRKAIHEDAIITTRDEVALNPQHISSDVVAFQDALDAQDFEQAVALYGGPFMDGFHINDAPEFERWVDVERDRLARDYATTLENLAQQYTARGDTPAAVAALRKLAAHDPYSGRVACMLMLALEASGDRAAALQHARTHAALLQSEFGADADPEVEALAARLRREPREAAPAPPPHDITPPPRAAHMVGKRSVIVPAAVTAVLTVLLIAAAIRWLARNDNVVEGNDPVRTIAVLPFRNLTPNEANTFFSDGLTEDIINALSSVPSLKVVGRTSTFSIRGDVDVREVGQRLNVDHVLYGTVRMGNDRVRVTTRLISTATRHEVWNEDYNRPLAMHDLLTIQEDIARSVVSELEASVTDSLTRAPLVARQTDDVEAFQLFVTGRSYLYRRTVPDMMRALQFFEKAIARDTAYALAYAGKAEALALLGAFDYGALRPGEAYPAARAAAQRALRIDPNVAEAHAVLATIEFNYDRDWAAAEKSFRRAIQLNHGSSTARHWYALLLNVAGRRPEAFAQSTRARELEPVSAVAAAGLARYYYFGREYEQAIEEFHNALRIDSSFVTAHVGLGITYAVSGQHQAAIRQFESAARFLGMTPPVIHGLLAYTYGLAGKRSDARHHYQTLQAARRAMYVPPELVAIAQIGIGDPDAAIESLNQAAQIRSGGVNYIRVDPIVDPIRSHPRFDDLLGQVFGQTR